MLPLTTPFRRTVGAATDPSMVPRSLTDSTAEPARSVVTLPLMWPSTCRPPANSTSPLMRVLGPIKVSISALLGFRLNIHPPFRLIGARHVGFDRHALRLPDERLPKPVT